MNRLTITLDDDLYAMARAYAVTHKLSLSKAISQLLRQRSSSPSSSSSSSRVLGEESSPVFSIHPVTLLPVVKGRGVPITNEDVQHANDDEDVRHLEMMGLSPEEIRRSPNS